MRWDQEPWDQEPPEAPIGRKLSWLCGRCGLPPKGLEHRTLRCWAAAVWVDIRLLLYKKTGGQRGKMTCPRSHSLAAVAGKAVGTG